MTVVELQMKLNALRKKAQFVFLNAAGVLWLILALNESSYAGSETRFEVRNILNEVLYTITGTEEAIKRGEIDSLHTELVAVRLMLADLNLKIDREMLVGGWQSAETKKEARKLLDLLESIKTLCFIGVAFTSNYYEYPDKYIPNSVKDSVSKMYSQLESLDKEVENISILAKKLHDK